LLRNCILKHVIAGKTEERIEVTGRRGRIRKQLVYYFKEKREYWKLKAEAIDRALWATVFGRGCGHVLRETSEYINGFE